jgi:tripartite-type tricarboxylate transporter receptor subunit TctC
VIGRLNADLTSIIKSPEVAQRIQEIYFEPVGSSAQELRKRVETEISEWSALARDVGINAQ